MPRVDDVGAVLGERHATHGDFSENARVSQAIKQVFRATRNWPSLTDTQREALEMIALKLSRFLTGDAGNADHLVDLVGYATLIIKENERR